MYFLCGDGHFLCGESHHIRLYGICMDGDKVEVIKMFLKRNLADIEMPQ